MGGRRRGFDAAEGRWRPPAGLGAPLSPGRSGARRRDCPGLRRPAAGAHGELERAGDAGLKPGKTSLERGMNDGRPLFGSFKVWLAGKTGQILKEVPTNR